jgi:hypothetical protein
MQAEDDYRWDTSFEAGQVLEELSDDFSAASIEYIRLAGIFREYCCYNHPLDIDMKPLQP